MPKGASIVTKAYDLPLWLLPRVTVAFYLSHYLVHSGRKFI